MPLPQRLRNWIPFPSSRRRRNSDLIWSACWGLDRTAPYTDRQPGRIRPAATGRSHNLTLQSGVGCVELRLIKAARAEMRGKEMCGPSHLECDTTGDGLWLLARAGIAAYRERIAWARRGPVARLDP
jgi:hypothetical protein